VRRFWLAALALAASAAALPAEAGRAEEGLASWYGGKFQGRRTASGEIFDTRRLTAAHRSLPFGTQVLVTNLTNGKSVTVRINDRGPFVAGRVIDLSLAAAAAIGLAGKGVVPVRLEVLAPGAAAAPRAADGRSRAAGQPAAVYYCLQLGSFRRRANAESLQARLEAAGFPAELETARGGIIRVVLRRVASGELTALRARLAAAGWEEALVRVEL
jgi:rare lipoprotein A